VYVFYLGIVPAWISLAIGAVMGLMGCALLRAAWRRATRIDRLAADAGAQIG
jgi:predicted signal transduction protein with EAL and GGDEF domain